MSDIRQTWTLDINQLLAALAQAAQEVDNVETAVDTLGQQMDDAMDEAAASTEEAGDALEDMGDDAQEAGKKGKKAGEELQSSLKGVAAAAAATAAAMGLVVKQVIDFSAETNLMVKRAKGVGASAEEFQKIQGALDLMTDGSAKAEVALLNLNRKIDEARTKGGLAGEQFERMGLDAAELARMPLDERFLAIADGISQLGDRAAQTAVAADLMGRAGRSLVDAFSQGAGPFRESFDQMERAGLITTDVATRSEALQDALYLLHQAFKALKTQVLDPMQPVLSSTADRIQAIMVEARETGDLEQLGEALNKLFAEDVLDGLVDMLEMVIKLSGVLDTLADVLSIVKNGTTLVIDAFVALFDKGETLRESINDMADAFLSLGEKVGLVKDPMDAVVETTKDMEEGMRALRGEVRLTRKEFELMNQYILEEYGLTAPGALDTFLGKFDKTTGRVKEGAEQQHQAVAGAVSDAVEEEGGRLGELAREHVNELQDAWQGYVPSIQKSVDEAAVVWKTSTTLSRDWHDEALEEAREFNLMMVQSATASMASMLDSFTGLAYTLYNRMTSSGEELTDAQKAQAMEAWQAGQVLAMSTAALNTALAITNIMATVPAPAWPFAIPAALAQLAVQEAIIATEPPPKLHAGGMIDEVHVLAQRGEAMVNNLGVKTRGGEEGIRAMNRGERAGGNFTIIQRVANRTTNASTHEAVRTRSGDLYDELVRTIQPKSGTHVPSFNRA